MRRSSKTADLDVVLEERREGYWRYRRISDGLRWEVRGHCDKRGDCLVGAWIDGEYVGTIERAYELAMAYDGPDSPITAGFEGCCPLEVSEL